MTDLSAFWPQCLARFEAELSAQQFNTWIKPLVCVAGEDAIALYAANRFSLGFVKERFLSRIETFAEDILGRPVTIELRIGGAQAGASAPAAASPRSQGRPAPAPVAATPTTGSLADSIVSDVPLPNVKLTAPKPAIGGGHESTRLNPAFTFESLVTGKGNQLARAAALQIADNPGDSTYNPFFVYGGVGLGKTHLIQAIGNHVYQKNPQAKIRYIHAERYVADIMRAYQHKAFDEFKRYYHSLDLLLIDDIQFFAGKNRTMEEFFYAFNALLEGGKQVIMTCDSYPKQIEGMDERLISRFSWGLTVEIQPPELEMRVAILMKKAEADNLRLEEQLAGFAIRKMEYSRHLEVWLIRPEP